jgi:hypothetical protein
MFSKLCLGLSILSLTACSLRLNEEVEHPKINVNPLQSGCLSQGGDVMQRFLDASITDPELEGFFNCLDKAVVTFTDNTKGASSNQFKGTEIAGFLSKYFMNGKVIEPSFTNEIMILKQALMGGSSVHLTREELEKIRALLRVVKTEMVAMRPHMPMNVNTFLEKKYSPEQFETALATFQGSMNRIGQALAGSQSSYSFDRLAALLKEVKLFLYAELEGQETWVDEAVRLSYALRPAKSIFIAPPRDEILTTDWAKLYHLGPLYYSLYLKADFYTRSESEFTHGPGLAKLDLLFADMISLLRQAVKNQPNGSVASGDLEDLIEALHKNDKLPVKVDAANSLLRFVLVRLFQGRSPKKNFEITLSSLDKLEDTFQFTTEGLRAIETAFRKEFGDDDYASKSMSHTSFSRIANNALLAGTIHKNEVSSDAVQAVKFAAENVRTIFPNDSTTVFIPADKSRPRLSLSHMVKMHLLTSVNRLVFQAYGGRKAESLRESQVVDAADELFPVLEEFGWASGDTKASIPKRLFEASLFLYSSDGETRVNMAEALELEALLASTLTRAAKLHEDVADNCKTRKKDNKGNELVSAPCYRNQFLKHVKRNWAYIPGLATFFTQKSDADQKALFLTMESFLRKGQGEKDFTIGDSQSFVLLPYYIELLFSRFDADNNGLLDNAEADKAYPVFRPFLAAKAAEHGLNSPEDHHALFSFLLGYQTLPTEMKSTWVWRRYLAGNKPFQVDRGHVIQIFQKLLSL